MLPLFFYGQFSMDQGNRVAVLFYGPSQPRWRSFWIKGTVFPFFFLDFFGPRQSRLWRDRLVKM